MIQLDDDLHEKWDMQRRLWQHTDPKAVPLAKLTMAHALQVRSTPLERSYVDDLMRIYQSEEGVEVDALLVARIVAPAQAPHDRHPVDSLTPGALYVVDGFHRLQALLDIEVRAGGRHGSRQGSARCRVLDVTPRQALMMAASANAKHGRPLDDQDRHHILGAFLANGFHRNADGSVMSSRDIHAALRIKETDRTVRNWLKTHYSAYLAELKASHGQWNEEDDEARTPDDRQRIAALKRRKEALDAIGKTLADVARHRLDTPDLRQLQAHAEKLARAAGRELHRLKAPTRRSEKGPGSQ